jgi:hypothetical protein
MDTISARSFTSRLTARPPDNPFLGKPGVLPEIWANHAAKGLTFDRGVMGDEHGPRGDS